MKLFPKVIWDGYCCSFGVRIDKCPNWPHDCYKYMGIAMYWRKGNLIVLNYNKLKNGFSLFIALLHEFTHHIIYIFKLPKYLHKILDNELKPSKRILKEQRWTKL